MPRPRGKTPKPEVLAREQRVLQLRREGNTWQQISTQVGYASPSGASEAYLRACSRVVLDDVVTLRNLENDRLDFLFGAVWEPALSGDYKALELCLKIMTRRAKLVGLDSPSYRPETKTTNFSPDEVQMELAKIIRAFDKAKN